MAKAFIGTSGWIYGSWDEVFYPENLPYKEKLKYFSKHFKTTEVNYSFYHLPQPQIFRNWREQVPEDFVFSVKASRYITHIKRLKGAKIPLDTFIKNAENLGKKLGPILFQLPPSFKKDIKRLEKFLKVLPRNHKFVFEFRHSSWFNQDVYNLLKRYKVALCIACPPSLCSGISRRADSPRYPKEVRVTTSFSYIRMHAPHRACSGAGHGSKTLFSSKYTKKEIQELAKMVKKFLAQNKDVYVYFNNDAHGYAIENAKQLLKQF